MTIQLEAYQLAILIASVILAFWLLNKSTVRQTRIIAATQFAALTSQLKGQGDRFSHLERQVSDLRVELARDYVKRSDNVRDIASLKAQFSQLALTVERKLDEHAMETIKMIRKELPK